MAVIDGVCEFCGQAFFDNTECDCLEAKVEKEKN